MQPRMISPLCILCGSGRILWEVVNSSVLIDVTEDRLIKLCTVQSVIVLSNKKCPCLLDDLDMSSFFFVQHSEEKHSLSGEREQFHTPRKTMKSLCLQYVLC